MTQEYKKAYKKAVIVVKDFSKRYGDLKAVDDISFEVMKMKFLVLLDQTALARQLRWNV